MKIKFSKLLIIISIIFTLNIIGNTIFATDLSITNQNDYENIIESNEEKINKDDKLIIEPRDHIVSMDTIIDKDDNLNFFERIFRFIKNIFKNEEKEEKLPSEFEMDYINTNYDNLNKDELVEMPTINKYENKYYSKPNKEEDLTDEVVQKFRNNVKKHIMNEGQVLANINSNKIENNDGILTLNEKRTKANKTATIIGWADNFSRDNFAEDNKPDSDGAYIALVDDIEDIAKNNIVYISYEDYNVESEMVGLIPNPTLNGIYIASHASTLSYTAGQNFDPTGLSVMAYYGDEPIVQPCKGWYVTNGSNLYAGQTSVTIQYSENGITVFTYENITVTAAPTPTQTPVIPSDEVVLDHIRVGGQPKVNYYIGDTFDPTGINVIAFYSNGTYKQVTGWRVVYGNDLQPGDRWVEIEYTENNITRTVAVNITVENRTLINIEITNPTTQYYEGDNFSTTGMGVSAKYDNDTSKTLSISDLNITGPTNHPEITRLTSSVSYVTVSYTERGVTASIKINITVTPLVLERIEIETPPSKTKYYEGDKFNSAGMTVRAYFNNKTNRIVEGWTVDKEGETLYVSDKYVTISYRENGTTVTKSYMITVTPPPLDRIEIETQPSKTDYYVGDTFNSAGMTVRAYFKNNTNRIVNGWIVTNGTNLQLNRQYVTISYTENGTATKDYMINVTAPALDRIEIETLPSKIEYYAGETFEPGEMTVKAYFKNNTDRIVNGWIVTNGDKLTVDRQYVTISYTENGTATLNFPITVRQRTSPPSGPSTPSTDKKILDRIEISGEFKKEYTEGDSFDNTGMIVTPFYKNDDNPGEPVTEYDIEPEGALTLNNKKITISYTEDEVTVSAEIEITVSEKQQDPPGPAQKILDRIEVTGNYKTEYLVGEKFDTKGMIVTAFYKNDDYPGEPVTEYDIEPEGALTLNNKKITISYTEDEVTVSAEIEITVSKEEEEVVLTSISITAPTKTVYIAGENFDPAGMEVTANYSDGSNKIVTNYDIISGTNLILGQTEVTISYKEGEITKTAVQKITVGKNPDDPEDKIITEAWVTLNKNVFEYTGSEIIPIVTVKNEENTLVKDEDYTVTFSDNTEIGTATVSIQGKNEYKGLVTMKFTIMPISFDKLQVKLSETECTFDGTEKKPTVEVLVGEKKLQENIDYTVEYSNNINIGTATVLVKGKGHYTGSVNATFEIVERNISQTKVELDKDNFTYNGSEIKPNITITDEDLKENDDSYTLVENTDYTIKYSKNTNAGIAEIEITGTGIYKGKVVKTFTITAKSIENFTIELDKTSYEYDGKEKEPTVTVKDENTTLEKDKDFTLEYQNNVNVGTAKVTVTGIGNYTGLKEKTYQIVDSGNTVDQTNPDNPDNPTIPDEPTTKKNINNLTIQLNKTNFVYDGTEKKPTVTIKDNNKTLVKDEDYTLEYSSNINVGTAKVVITGIGNYQGNVEKKYLIEAKSITNLEIELDKTEYTYDGIEKEPEVTVTNGTKTLKLGTDYTVTYKNNLNAGTAIVIVAGKGNYKDSTEVEYTIKEKSISTLEIELSEITFKYDDEAKSPNVIVKDGENELIEGIDYTLVYTNNVEPGTAKVTIKGIGKYVGSIEKTYTIIDDRYSGKEDEDINNNSNSGKDDNNSNKYNDGTQIKNNIPQTGENVAIIAIIFIALAGAGVFLIKNIKYKDI